MNIFVLKLYFRLKILSKKCKFHFQLAFFEGEACGEMAFPGNMTALPVQLKNNFRVESVLSVQLDTLGDFPPLHFQKWSKWFLCPNRLAPKGWSKF